MIRSDTNPRSTIHSILNLQFLIHATIHRFPTAAATRAAAQPRTSRLCRLAAVEASPIFQERRASESQRQAFRARSRGLIAIHAWPVRFCSAQRLRQAASLELLPALPKFWMLFPPRNETPGNSAFADPKKFSSRPVSCEGEDESAR